MLNYEFLELIVEDLLGSCQSIEDVLEKHHMELDDLGMKDLGYIDDAIFLCDFCGWWYDLGEIQDYDSQSFCGDCNREAINYDNLEDN